MDKCGQTSSISVIGFAPVYLSRTHRPRGDVNTRYRHLRHTWTRSCQSPVSHAPSLIYESNISMRTLSGNMTIVTLPTLVCATGKWSLWALTKRHTLIPFLIRLSLGMYRVPVPQVICHQAFGATINRSWRVGSVSSNGRE